MARKSRRRSALYTGTEAEDAEYTGTPGTKADGTHKRVLDMTMYDDVEILMDLILIHFTMELDTEEAEGRIRAEYEVVKGDLPAFIRGNFRQYEERGLTPVGIRATLKNDRLRLLSILLFGKVVQPMLVGLLTGGLGTLLFSHAVLGNTPFLPLTVRYALAALLIIPAFGSLRRLHDRHRASYLRLGTCAILGAVLAFQLLKGL